jgi:hypothetical protein
VTPAGLPGRLDEQLTAWAAAGRVTFDLSDLAAALPGQQPGVLRAAVRDCPRARMVSPAPSSLWKIVTPGPGHAAPGPEAGAAPLHATGGLNGGARAGVLSPQPDGARFEAGQAIAWLCPHSHASRAEAVQCAAGELERRAEGTRLDPHDVIDFLDELGAGIEPDAGGDDPRLSPVAADDMEAIDRVIAIIRGER